MDKKEQEMIRQARNEYQRRWYHANPEKARARQMRYWLKKAQEIADREKEVEDVAEKH